MGVSPETSLTIALQGSFFERATPTHPRMRACDADQALATRIARVRDMLSRPLSNSEQVASQIASMAAKFGEKDKEGGVKVHG